MKGVPVTQAKEILVELYGNSMIKGVLGIFFFCYNKGSIARYLIKNVSLLNSQVWKLQVC